MKANMINTNSVMKTICAVVMLLGMSVSVWGADETLSLGYSLWGTGGGYASSSGSKNTDASHAVDISWSNVLKSNSTIQLQASGGEIHSTSLPKSSSNNKIKSIKITVTNNTIKLYCSADGSSWGDDISFTSGTAKDVSSGGYKYFKITSTSSYASASAVEVVYTQASPQTVTFNKQGGEFDDPSVFTNTNQITEDEGGAGVTLPLVNPTTSMEDMGWGFYGWAESAVASPTTTAPTIVGKAGDTYYPSSATTLYAVFAKGEFTKITSESEITSGGKYLIAGWYLDKVHMMTSTYIHTDDYYMKEKVVSEYTSGKIRVTDIDGTWRYVITGSSNAYFIQDVVHNSNNYIDTYYTNWYNCSYSSSHSYKIVFDGGTCYIKNNQGSYPYLVLFAKGDFGTVSSVWAGMLLYKETTECMFASNPKTVKVVASPVAGGAVTIEDEASYAFSGASVEDITASAAANSGYDFLRWESSANAKFYNQSTSEYDLSSTTEAEEFVKATGDATLTAYFYQNRSVTYSLSSGVTGEVGNPTTITKDEMDGFSSGFNLAAHYKNMTLTSVTMGGSPLTEGAAADYEWELDDGFAMLTIHHDNIDGDIVITVSATPMEYTKYAFSCAELTLTPVLVTAGTPIFITSTASKMVRSQDKIEITGTGLTPSTTLTFPGLPSKFAIKKADGTALATNSSGVIEEDAYIFYTPDAEDTSDGLDKLTGITVSVGGAKPITKNLTQEIIGRHLPADFVIAAKNTTTNKWYALPANMSGTGNPVPVEIAVDDINNPTIAYTAASNVYNLYLSADKEKVQLGMKNNVDGSSKSYALWANNAVSGTDIGKNTGLAENTLGDNYKWTLTQTNTSITNPQDAKYTISNPNNANMLKLWLAAGGTGVPYWGLYASGISELRLIPASSITFTEAYFVEWGQHGGVIEVDATGIDATSVTAHLGASSATASLSQTQTSGKSRASIYDYTVNFGNDINFAAAASNGALLTLEWKNGATTKAMTSLVVPKIIAASSTLSSHGATDGDWSSAEVHVLPGVTLTANAGDFTSNDVMIRHLEIYPGATVVVTKGSQASGTLKVKTLVLRNGWTRAGEKAYDVARLYITPTTTSLAKNAPSEDVWYTDWYIDYDQYYPIAVPWDVTLANITYRYCSVEPTVGHDKNIRLRYYDGEGRASSGQSQIGQNWKLYGADGAESVPTKLEPSKGYALTAKRPSGKAFSILRMPLGIPSNDWTALGEQGEVSSVRKNQVSVTGWGKGTADWYAMGWNFIGNPYMCTFNGDDGGIGGKLELQNGGSIKYATIPDVDFQNYYQVPIAEANLKPASGFFIQAENPAATYITFASGNIVPPSAPARYKTKTEVVPEQEAYIRLSYEGGKDQMGIIINEDYTEAYEVNADLAKVLGEGNFVKTYMQYGGMDMAYVAINGELAKEWIPVTVILPTTGEYTYSITASSEVAELEGVYLIDYYNGDKITNLIEENYIFEAEAGTISNRFAINATVGQHKVPTDIDVVNVGGDLKSDAPFKFIYHDKAYIYHRGVIYDAMGKRVREINK